MIAIDLFALRTTPGRVRQPRRDIVTARKIFELDLLKPGSLRFAELGFPEEPIVPTIKVLGASPGGSGPLSYYLDIRGDSQLHTVPSIAILDSPHRRSYPEFVSQTHAVEVLALPVIVSFDGDSACRACGEPIAPLVSPQPAWKTHSIEGRTGSAPPATVLVGESE